MKLSVRARTAIVAALAFGIVVAVAGVIGVGLLRSSLIAEVDRSNELRALDIAVQTADEEVPPFVAAGLDPTTVAAVVDVDGDVLSSTDDVDGDALVRFYLSEDGPFDVSFADLDSVVGSDDMRGITVLVEESDEFLETFVFVASSKDPVERTVSDVVVVVLVTAPLLTALVGMLVWVVAGRALRPVERIRREVDDITGSDLHRRVPEPGTRGEIGALAVTMNAMLERLERASEQQRRFAADASHELRSPLASIAAQLDVDLAHPETAEWAATAHTLRLETLRMQTLVDDLLLLARSEGRSTELAVSRVGLDDVVSETVAMVPTRAGVTVDTGEIARVDIVANPGQIARLVTNLLTNAVRHATGHVAVTVTTGPGVGLVHVDDDGLGVPPTERERVFDRFIRLDEARTTDAGGSGLGLALCREICRQHHGSIDVGDSPLGGARFTVTLPLSGPMRRPGPDS